MSPRPDMLVAAPRVAMLVVNNGVDVRVLKEAVSVKSLGYDVRIFGRLESGNKRIDSAEGITIERVAPIGNAATLWFYSRHTAMPLSIRQRLRFARIFVVWALADYKLGFQATPYDIDRGIFPERPSRLKRLTKDPLRIIESFLHRFTTKLANRPATSRTGRLLRRFAKQLGDPARLFQENEHLLFALCMYDTVARFKPAVVHSHDLYMLRCGVALKNTLRCKLVYDAHEYERDRARDFPDWRRKLCQAEEEGLVRQADARITVSDSIADRMVEHYAIAKPAVIFNTSFGGPKYERECGELYTSLRSLIGLGAGTPLVVHIGKLFNMHTQTGLFREMIQMLPYLPDVHLALLGPNTTLAKSQVTGWSKRYYVDNRVHVVDPVPYRYVPSFISDATLGIVAMYGGNLNTEYAMPNKLFEMALAGIPFIVSDQTEIRRFVTEQARGLVVDCNDPQKIAAAIRKIVDDPGSFTYTEEQKERIRTNFGWPAQAAKLKQLYYGLAKPASSDISPVHRKGT